MVKVKQEVIWQPQPGPQTRLVTCPVFEVFFGGARGGGKTDATYRDWETDRKSTRLNSSHRSLSRMPSSA